MVSSAPTKSVNTLSTWSRPAKTVMMSELGFVYFLARTAVKNVLSVWATRQSVSSSVWAPPPLPRVPPGTGHALTSKAFESAGAPCEARSTATALEKSSRVW